VSNCRAEDLDLHKHKVCQGYNNLLIQLQNNQQIHCNALCKKKTG